jgi:hypothetical protein
MALFTLSAVPIAAADDVDRQVRQLAGSDRFKVRLSAAVSLSKARDPRAVRALARALREESAATIRRVAVAGLGELLRRPLPASAARVGLAALAAAATRDRDAKVRSSAARARRLIERRRRPRSRSRGTVFLAVGTPNDPRRMAPRGVPREIESALTQTIRRRAPDYEVGPARLAGGDRSYFVAATVRDVAVRRRGSQTEVRCQVAVRVAPYRDGRERLVAGQSASAEGTGRVLGGSSRRAVADAKRQCVVAVVEQVTERQVLPFVRRVAGR